MSKPDDPLQAALDAAAQIRSDRIDLIQHANEALALALDELARSVTSARHAGATWLQIGETLGTSPQAAQQRFGT